MKKKIFWLIICFLLFPFLLMHFNLTNFDSTLENRNSYEKPVINIKKLREYPKEYENYFNDFFGFRNFCISAATKIKLKLFNTSSSQKVIKGNEGWYYYTLDNNLELYYETNNLINLEILEKIKNQQLEMRDYLKKRGKEYLIILTPSKVSMYPEYLSKKNLQKDTVIDIIYNYLKNNTDLNIVNTKEELLKNKTNNLYYKTDTHWTQEASYIAYNQILKKLNEVLNIREEKVNVDYLEGKYQGEFSNMLGVKNVLSKERVKEIKIINNSLLPVVDDNILNSILEIKNQLNFKLPISIYQNKERNKKNAIIYHDSFFSETYKMQSLLSQHFSNTLFIWNDYIFKKFNENYDYDIVIFETTERYFSRLHRPEDYLFYPSGTIDVERESNNFKIKVNNIGEFSWTEDKFIRLGIFINGIDTGIRKKIDIKSIGRNENYIFEYQHIKSTEDKTIQFKLLKEGIIYFSESQVYNLN